MAEMLAALQNVARPPWLRHHRPSLFLCLCAIYLRIEQGISAGWPRHVSATQILAAQVLAAHVEDLRLTHLGQDWLRRKAAFPLVLSASMKDRLAHG